MVYTQKMKDEKIKQQKPVYIFGKHPIVEKLLNDPKSVEKLFIKETLDKKVIEDIKKLASKARIPFVFVPEKKLTELSDGGVHQGLGAIVLPATLLSLDEWLESIAQVTNPGVLLLDELEDPHNVGAIIRSAVAFGIHGIIMPKHRQAPLSGAVYKSAVGQIDKIPLVRVTNVNDAIRTLKENKFWVIGLDQEGKSVVSEQDFTMPTCFVIGSEGSGMRAQTQKLCDFLVRIPMEHDVESLNASVSAAVLMYEWKRRKQQKK